MILKKANGFLSIFGLKLVSKLSFHSDMGEMLANVKKIGFTPKTIIDVGVAYGTTELYESYKNCKFLLIEPIVEWENNLKEICSKYDDEYVLAAAGTNKGIAKINVHEILTGSSFFKDRDGQSLDGFEREVPLIRLDDIVNEKNLNGPYLLKLDVQGAELLVLDGAEKIMQEAELILVETPLHEFMINSPQFYDIVEYMKKHGFVVYDIYSGWVRPYDNSLAFVDLGFVKEDGFFRQSKTYATDEQWKKLNKVLKKINKPRI